MEPPQSALPVTGAIILGGFALTENFAALPGAVAAYAAAWWVMGLGRDVPSRSGESR